MNPEIREILPLVSSPARYTGGEKNVVQKSRESVRLRFALAFPDVYEVGMSHLGLDILYHVLNQRAGIAAERVFAPWSDMERHLRARGIPLPSLESATALREFDVIGFSLQHELCHTNVLNMLDLARIPLWASERDDRHPWVIAGGPGLTNPEPVADFFDAVLIGEGEEAILDICDCLLRARKERRPRRFVLEDLSEIKGLYVPSLFDVAYDQDGTIGKIIPQKARYPQVTRRILCDLDGAGYPTAPVVPWLKTVHDRLSVEISRGCKRGCRFCLAGFIYRPYRERKPETVHTLIDASLAATGYEEVSLLSLSSGDYGSIETLLRSVMDRCEKEHVALSFPSLRVETLSPDMLRQIRRVRKTGLTLAPEAATARLRRVINKEMDEETLLEAARNLYREGWNLIKLYFMIGLPTETERDVEEIAHLAGRVLQQGKGAGRAPRLNVSVSTFVPKPHTPFQWEPQLTLVETTLRQGLLRKGLNRRGIRFKWHDARMSLLEGVFSRGDRRLARVLYDAFRKGCRFDGWSEAFQWQSWCHAFEENGVDMLSYLRERAFSETLPWDHIQCGVSKEFLRREYDRSRQEAETEPCRRGCRTCGVCDGQTVSVVSWEKAEEGSPQPTTGLVAKTAAQRLVLEFEKVGPARFLGHLDMVKAFRRAASRARIGLRYSQGFHPAPKMSFRAALPLGFESLSEEMEWDVELSVDRSRLPAALNSQLPQGLRITRALLPSERDSRREVDPGTDRYLVALSRVSSNSLERRIEAFMACDQWVFSGFGGNGAGDIRCQIETIALVDPAHLDGPVKDAWFDLIDENTPLMEVVLVKRDGRRIRIDNALRSIFSLSEEEKKQMRILKLGGKSHHAG